MATKVKKQKGPIKTEKWRMPPCDTTQYLYIVCFSGFSFLKVGILKSINSMTFEISRN
jgi:hypothetical protein